MSAWHDLLLYAVFLSYCALLVGAAAWDAWKYIVPNQISLSLIVLFLLTAPFWGAPVPWLSHIGAGVAVLAIGMVLFSFGCIGGGDVKLISAVSFWTGFGHLLNFLVAVSIAGGVLALLLLAVRGYSSGYRGSPTKRSGEAQPRVLSAGEGVPYAVAIAPAGIFAGGGLPGVGWPWL